MARDFHISNEVKWSFGDKEISVDIFLKETRFRDHVAESETDTHISTITKELNDSNPEPKVIIHKYYADDFYKAWMDNIGKQSYNSALYNSALYSVRDAYAETERVFGILKGMEHKDKKCTCQANDVVLYGCKCGGC
jgi:hypothetical protein